MASWRPMNGADLAAVESLAARLHPHHPEATAVFAERLALFPTGCAVLESPAGICGYGLAHAARIGHPPRLDSLLGRLPAEADGLHLHDIALLPAARGQGAADAWLASLLSLAASLNLPRLSLIAVAGKQGFWQRRGFVARPPAGDAELAARLASYGTDAVYMLRPGAPR